MKRKLHLTCFILSLLFNQEGQAVDTAEIKFSEIYDKAIWGRNEEGLGYSGGGSSVKNAAAYMEFLQNFLKVNAIKSVVDVGCGDWTFSRYLDWNGIDYTGYDIVKNVIERNLVSFSTPSIQFIHGNAVHMDLPEADLLICKDVLQHLSNEDVFFFLNQIHKFKYCLITNDVDQTSMGGANSQISSGGYRTLDLTAAPFNVDGINIFAYPSESNLKQILLIMN
ncbi:MAG: class I SAM-dependent methyltransferase [Parachlamydiaceae bacterium]